MEKTILIDGREVKFRATAAIPRLYRIKFGRDIMQDMAALRKSLTESKEKNTILPVETLTVFENISYLMAKHADPDMEARTVENWLDGFESFSIYAVFPQLFELWKDNISTLVQAKKNQADRPPHDNASFSSQGLADGNFNAGP